MDDYDDEPAQAIAGEATKPTSSEFSPSFEQLLPSIDNQLPPFVAEQRVLCQDKGKLYEAVIRQSRYGIVGRNKKQISSSQLLLQKPQWSYLVHFLGWNTRYDKWVKQEDILPDTEEHRSRLRQQQQAEHEQLQLAATLTPNTTMATTITTKSSSKRKATDLATLPKKQRRELSSLSNGLISTSEYCDLPFTLQAVLIEEWEHITRTNTLGLVESQPSATAAAVSAGPSSNFGWRPLRNVHHLPAPITIRHVLHQFGKQQSGNVPSKQQQSQQLNRAECSVADACQSAEEVQQQVQQQEHRRRVKDFVQDLLALVEDALPLCLLYPQERPQWESFKTKESQKSVCDFYGAEYLLRLMVRLPILMPTVKKEVGQLIAELIVMLQKNRNTCFKGQYREPQPNELLETEREWMQQQPYRHGIDDNDIASTALTGKTPQKMV